MEKVIRKHRSSAMLLFNTVFTKPRVTYQHRHLKHNVTPYITQKDLGSVD